MRNKTFLKILAVCFGLLFTVSMQGMAFACAPIAPPMPQPAFFCMPAFFVVPVMPVFAPFRPVMGWMPQPVPFVPGFVPPPAMPGFVPPMPPGYNPSGFAAGQSALQQKYATSVGAIATDYQTKLGQLQSANQTALQGVYNTYNPQIASVQSQLAGIPAARQSELTTAWQSYVSSAQAAMASGNWANLGNLYNAYATQAAGITQKYAAQTTTLQSQLTGLNSQMQTALTQAGSGLPGQISALQQQETTALNGLQTSFNAEYQTLCTQNGVTNNAYMASAAWNQVAGGTQAMISGGQMSMPPSPIGAFPPVAWPVPMMYAPMAPPPMMYGQPPVSSSGQTQTSGSQSSGTTSRPTGKPEHGPKEKPDPRKFFEQLLGGLGLANHKGWFAGELSHNKMTPPTQASPSGYGKPMFCGYAYYGFVPMMGYGVVGYSPRTFGMSKPIPMGGNAMYNINGVTTNIYANSVNVFTK